MHKQQATDQRQLARIVIGHDSDPPTSIFNRDCSHLNQVVGIQLPSQDCVLFDLRLVKSRAVGGIHACQVPVEIRRTYLTPGVRGFCHGVTALQEMLVDATYGPTVLVVASHKLGASAFTFKTQPPSQLEYGLVVTGKRGRLPIVHHLQMVLDGAQKDIPVREHPVLIGRQKPVGGQPLQCVQRVAATHLGVLPPMDQLQILGNELHIPDGTDSQLDLPPFPTPLAQMGFGALFHAVNVAPYRLALPAHQDGLRPLGELVSNLLAPGNDTRLEQCLFLPQLGVLLQVGSVAVQRGDQHAVASPGTQPHVYPIEKPFGRHP